MFRTILLATTSTAISGVALSQTQQNAPPFVYQLKFAAEAKLDFSNTGVPPPENEVIDDLRSAALAQASHTCVRMLGPNGQVDTAGKESLTESILRLNYEVPVICRRQIRGYNEVTPYLARFAASSDAINFRDILEPAFADIAAFVGPSLLAVLNDPATNVEGRIEITRYLGVVLAQNSPRDLEILESLFQLIPEHNLLAYEVELAMGRNYGASSFLQQHMDGFLPLAQARLARGISIVYKIGSSYEVPLAVLQTLLNESDDEVLDTMFSAIQLRGLRTREMDALFARLSELALLPQERRSENVYAALGLESSERTAELLTQSFLSIRFNPNADNMDLLFRSMLALRGVTKFQITQTTLTHLREIADATLGHERNAYVQRLAKELILSLERP